MINIDILEELTFLSTPRGGGLVLDITQGTSLSRESLAHLEDGTSSRYYSRYFV